MDLQHKARVEELDGWRVRIVSYCLGGVWHCTVDNVDPGANIARGRGESRDEAEESALAVASTRLGLTKRVSS